MKPILFSTPPKRILIIKPSAIGDVVHALPVLHLLRKRWPDAHISWLITPACASLIEGHPELDQVILFDRKRFGHAWRSWAATKAFGEFCRQLKSESYDLVIDLQGLFRSGWLGWRSGAKLRVGLSNARELATFFYSHVIRVSWTQHAVDRNLAIAEALGCGRLPVEFNFGTREIDRVKIAELVGSTLPYAVLIPGTNWATKRWPVKHFVETAKKIREELGYEIVVAGSLDEAELGAQIPGLNLCGKTNLRELVALLEKSNLVIANDSGPMHIAAALGKPLVSLFGPTNPARTGPYSRPESVISLNLPCSPCYSRTCSHQSCLQWLEPDAVIKKGVELTLKGNARAMETDQ